MVLWQDRHTQLRPWCCSHPYTHTENRSWSGEERGDTHTHAHTWLFVRIGPACLYAFLHLYACFVLSCFVSPTRASPLSVCFARPIETPHTHTHTHTHRHAFSLFVSLSSYELLPYPHTAAKADLRALDFRSVCVCVCVCVCDVCMQDQRHLAPRAAVDSRSGGHSPILGRGTAEATMPGWSTHTHTHTQRSTRPPLPSWRYSGGGLRC